MKNLLLIAALFVFGFSVSAQSQTESISENKCAKISDNYEIKHNFKPTNTFISKQERLEIEKTQFTDAQLNQIKQAGLIRGKENEINFTY